MASADLLPLIQLNDIEPSSTVPDWFFDPKNIQAFVNQLKQFLAVDVKGLNSLSVGNIIISDSKPEPKNRGKVWIKTSWPFAIVTILDGEFRPDYGFCQYPVNTPFLALESAMTPTREYVSQISGVDLVKFGIPDTTSGATNRMRWFMFQPPEITLD